MSAWNNWLMQPFTWLFYCIFQPIRFKREFERAEPLHRVVPMLRLSLPSFCVAYLLVLLVQLILHKGSVNEIANLIPIVTLTTLIGVASGTAMGIAWSVAGGIALSLAWGIANGITANLGLDIVIATGIIDGIAIGIVGGIVGGIIGRITDRAASGIALGIATGMVVGIVGHVVTGEFIGGTVKGIVEGVVGGIMGGLLARLVWRKGKGLLAGVHTGIVGGMVVAVSEAIVVGTIVSTGDPLTSSNPVSYISGIAIAVVLGITLCVAVSILEGIVVSVLGGVVVTIVLITMSIKGSVEPSTLSIPIGVIASALSSLGYIFSYYRLPLYPFSALSTITAYSSSRKNPYKVFSYLHRSSLYWDERVYLPLPSLKRTLLLAAEPNLEQTLEEIVFIATERPQQIAAARATSLEIAMRDLEMRESLRDIALASLRLTEILPKEAGLIDPRWETSLARLNDASRDAARARSPLGLKARRSALQDMIASLSNIYHQTASHDPDLNTRLGNVIETWRTIAQYELEQLEKAFDIMSLIDNPYNPGPALEPRDSLFVGRRDLAVQLADALSRGSRRPTFLLQGERRMGKSSLLKQLPDLLGARYLPIFFDLQNRGFSSSSAVFLGKIADEIYKAMSTRGIQVKRLIYERLREASQRNEAEVYYLFERWFEEIEQTLGQEDRTLLLTFDEFEKLEEVVRDGYLNLGLLLDWFRNIIQHHSRLALLFSGVRSFDEMGPNWAAYFVNVQTLRVSFLQPAEAYQLITSPVPDFPGKQIFGKKVVEEIMRVTACQPFLVQAICSTLLDRLNADKRTQIELQHVKDATNQVLRNWGSTFFRDLWERTNQVQRACLGILRDLGESDLLTIEQQSILDRNSIRQALEALLKRDLVLFEHNRYRIAAPIFQTWVEQSSDRLEIIQGSLSSDIIRQILFDQGLVDADAFPNIAVKYIDNSLKQYMQEHPDADVEYQEGTHSLRLYQPTADIVRQIGSLLEPIVHDTKNNARRRNDEEFEEKIKELFHLLFSSIGLTIMHKRLSKDFTTFLINTETVFENVRVPNPMPVLVCPQSEISYETTESLRHLLMSGKLGSQIQIAIVILFCEKRKLDLGKQLLAKTLGSVYARDIVVINQDDLLDIVTAKDAERVLRRLVLSQVSLTAVDPYIITGPTPVHFFFGREPLLREISDGVTITSYAITGGRRIGKTSILSCLHRSRLPARGFRTLYQDCSTISTYDAFLTASIRDWQPEPPAHALVTFGDLLESPPGDKPLVLLLDEVDKLVPEDRKNGWKIFNTLRALVNAKHAQIILSGERTLREALKDAGSPLFNLANDKLLGPLDFRAVKELVTQPMKQLEIEIVDEESIVKHIYEFTSGHPNVVQRLCRRLIDRLNEQGRRRVTLKDVMEVTNDPDFQEKDFLQTYWEAATPLEKIITLVLSRKAGVYGLREIHQLVYEQALIQPNMIEMKGALDRLVDLRSLLKRSQRGYEFAIEAFPHVLVNTITVADLLSVLREEYSEMEQNL